MAKMCFTKSCSIDDIKVNVSEKGTSYYYIHITDKQTGDAVKLACSQAVYNQVKDLIPYNATIFVKFESWYDETIRRGGFREYVYNVME